MTREEFVRVTNYITAGCGKHLGPESLEVYFDLLGDLDAPTLLVAAKRVLLRHKFPTFPTIAELREAATLTQAGEVTSLSSAEAWSLAWDAAARTDPEITGSFERATAGLPPLVVRAMRAFGVNALCYGSEPITVIRAQYMRVYEQLAAREREAAVLPAATKRAIAAQGATPIAPKSKALSIAGWEPDAPPEGKSDKAK